MGLNGNINVTLQDYETQLNKSFTYIKAIRSQNIEVFSASPIRIREQKEISYFEIGASNITDSGAIIVNRSDKLKKSANKTSFNRQHLRVGDVVIAFRATPRFGVIVETPEVELVPNTSMIVIRTESDIGGASLCSFLNQQFVFEYLSSLMIDSNNKQLSVEMLSSLLIPRLDQYASQESLNKRIEIQTHYNKIRTLSHTLKI